LSARERVALYGLEGEHVTYSVIWEGVDSTWQLEAEAMAYQVVCISRATGAGGEELGRDLAERLGFRYVDDQIVLRAAATAGVAADEVAAAEQKLPLIRRILRTITGAGEGVSLPSTLVTYEGVEPWVRPPDYEALIRSAIEETASEGQAVIVAHAASHALAGREGVLRVLVTASADTRAARLAESEGQSASDARRQVESSDGERGDYLRRFYSVDEELPTHYDIVINTDVLKMAEAVAMLANIARG
jgi:cytidylate kinase